MRDARPSRRIQPDITPLNQMFSQMHIVITQEYDARVRFTNKSHPASNNLLSSLIGRMRLSDQNKLHGSLGIIQQSQQALRVMQQEIRTFIGCKTSRKTEGQYVFIQHMSTLPKETGTSSTDQCVKSLQTVAG